VRVDRKAAVDGEQYGVPISNPRMPPTAPRLSITTVCPMFSCNFAPTSLARMSLGPPGANGTIKRIGLVGYFSAAFTDAAVNDNELAITAARATAVRRMTTLLWLRNRAANFSVRRVSMPSVTVEVDYRT
jgi:hypothetical protein